MSTQGATDRYTERQTDRQTDKPVSFLDRQTNQYHFYRTWDLPGTCRFIVIPPSRVQLYINEDKSDGALSFFRTVCGAAFPQGIMILWLRPGTVKSEPFVLEICDLIGQDKASQACPELWQEFAVGCVLYTGIWQEDQRWRTRNDGGRLPA